MYQTQTDEVDKECSKTLKSMFKIVLDTVQRDQGCLLPCFVPQSSTGSYFFELEHGSHLPGLLNLARDMGTGKQLYKSLIKIYVSFTSPDPCNHADSQTVASSGGPIRPLKYAVSALLTVCLSLFPW